MTIGQVVDDYIQRHQMRHKLKEIDAKAAEEMAHRRELDRSALRSNTMVDIYETSELREHSIRNGVPITHRNERHTEGSMAASSQQNTLVEVSSNLNLTNSQINPYHPYQESEFEHLNGEAKKNLIRLLSKRNLNLTDRYTLNSYLITRSTVSIDSNQTTDSTRQSESQAHLETRSFEQKKERKEAWKEESKEESKEEWNKQRKEEVKVMLKSKTSIEMHEEFKKQLTKEKEEALKNIKREYRKIMQQEFAKSSNPSCKITRNEIAQKYEPAIRKKVEELTSYFRQQEEEYAKKLKVQEEEMGELEERKMKEYQERKLMEEQQKRLNEEQEQQRLMEEQEKQRKLMQEQQKLMEEQEKQKKLKEVKESKEEQKMETQTEWHTPSNIRQLRINKLTKSKTDSVPAKSVSAMNETLNNVPSMVNVSLLQAASNEQSSMSNLKPPKAEAVHQEPIASQQKQIRVQSQFSNQVAQIPNQEPISVCQEPIPSQGSSSVQQLSILSREAQTPNQEGQNLNQELIQSQEQQVLIEENHVASQPEPISSQPEQILIEEAQVPGESQIPTQEQQIEFEQVYPTTTVDILKNYLNQLNEQENEFKSQQNNSQTPCSRLSSQETTAQKQQISELLQKQQELLSIVGHTIANFEIEEWQYVLQTEYKFYELERKKNKRLKEIENKKSELKSELNRHLQQYDDDKAQLSVFHANERNRLTQELKAQSEISQSSKQTSKKKSERHGKNWYDRQQKLREARKVKFEVDMDELENLTNKRAADLLDEFTKNYHLPIREKLRLLMVEEKELPLKVTPQKENIRRKQNNNNAKLDAYIRQMYDISRKCFNILAKQQERLMPDSEIISFRMAQLNMIDMEREFVESFVQRKRQAITQSFFHFQHQIPPQQIASGYQMNQASVQTSNSNHEQDHKERLEAHLGQEKRKIQTEAEKKVEQVLSSIRNNALARSNAQDYLPNLKLQKKIERLRPRLSRLSTYRIEAINLIRSIFAVPPQNNPLPAVTTSATEKNEQAIGSNVNLQANNNAQVVHTPNYSKNASFFNFVLETEILTLNLANLNGSIDSISPFFTRFELHPKIIETLHIKNGQISDGVMDKLEKLILNHKFRFRRLRISNCTITAKKGLNFPLLQYSILLKIDIQTSEPVPDYRILNIIMAPLPYLQHLTLRTVSFKYVVKNGVRDLSDAAKNNILLIIKQLITFQRLESLTLETNIPSVWLLQKFKKEKVFQNLAKLTQVQIMTSHYDGRPPVISAVDESDVYRGAEDAY